ncbi:hypothetical protein KCU78_g2038, partial [Aureobasidium melanogenum]
MAPKRQKRLSEATDTSKPKRQRILKQTSLAVQHTSTTTTSAPSAYDLDPPPLSLGPNNENLARFRDAIDNGLEVKPGVDQDDWLSTDPPLRHILELDNYKNRKFKLVGSSPETYEIQRVVMGEDGEPVQDEFGGPRTVRVTAWKIEVMDTNDTKGKVIQPFYIPPHSATTRVDRETVIVDGRSVTKRNTIYKFNADCCLTTDICPDREQALNLASIVCQMLDKTPHSIPTGDWNTMQGGCLKWERILIEIAALVQWKPDIDFSKFPLDWCHDNANHIGFYSRPLCVVSQPTTAENKARKDARARNKARKQDDEDDKEEEVAEEASPAPKSNSKKKSTTSKKIIQDSDEEMVDTEDIAAREKDKRHTLGSKARLFATSPSSHTNCTISIVGRPDNFDVAAINAFVDEHLPPGFWFNGGLNSGMEVVHTPAADRACARLMGFFVYASVGMCGTSQKFRIAYDTIVDQFLLDPKKKKQTKKLTSQTPTLYSKPLSHADGFIMDLTAPVYAMLQPTAAVSVPGPGVAGSLATYIHDPSPVFYAWAYQKGINELSNNRGLLNAVQAVMRAAGSINNKEVSVEDARDGCCGCVTDELRRKTYHVCMTCGDLYLCSTMAVDQERHIVCRGCVRHWPVQGLTLDTRSLHGDVFADGNATLAQASLTDAEIRARKGLISTYVAQGSAINPDDRPGFPGGFLFLEKGVDDNAAKRLGYDTAEQVFDAKAKDHRIPRDESPSGRPLIVYFPNEPLRLRTHRYQKDREVLYQEAKDAPNVLINPKFIPEGLGKLTFLEPGLQQQDEKLAAEMGYADARAVTEARAADPKFPDIPTVIWTAEERYLNCQEQPKGFGYWRYLTLGDAEKANPPGAPKRTAVEYVRDGDFLDDPVNAAKVVWVPYDKDLNSRYDHMQEVLRDSHAKLVKLQADYQAKVEEVARLQRALPVQGSDPTTVAAVPNNSTALDSLLNDINGVNDRMSQLLPTSQDAVLSRIDTNLLLHMYHQQREELNLLKKGERQMSDATTVTQDPATEIKQLRAENARLRRGERHISTMSTESVAGIDPVSQQPRQQDTDVLMRDDERLTSEREAWEREKIELMALHKQDLVDQRKALMEKLMSVVAEHDDE